MATNNELSPPKKFIKHVLLEYLELYVIAAGLTYYYACKFLHVDLDSKFEANLVLVALAALMVAIGKDRLRENRLAAQIASVAQPATSMKVFEKWSDQEVSDLIGSARHSIVMLDTYFNEAQSWLPYIRRALEQRGTHLKIEIYQLSLKSGFGQQRLKEHPRKENKLPREYEAVYQAHINETNETFGDLARVELNFFQYSFMPELRLLVIDDEKYIFSWFPVHTYSTDHPCFYLRKHPLFPNDMAVLDGLIAHLNHVRKAPDTRSESDRTS